MVSMYQHDKYLILFNAHFSVNSFIVKSYLLGETPYNVEILKIIFMLELSFIKISQKIYFVLHRVTKL